jgi:hypothetical protein
MEAMNTLASPAPRSFTMLVLPRLIQLCLVAGLGLELPRDQVRTAELPTVLPDGHALSRGRRAADSVDALARCGVTWPDRTQWRNAHVIGALMLGCGMDGTAYAEVSVGSGLMMAFIAVVPLMIMPLNLLWGCGRAHSRTRASCSAWSAC